MKIYGAVLVLVGIFFGALLAAAYFSWRHGDTKTEFDSKVQCQDLARHYESENRQNNSATVEAVAYSAKRNSCIAKVLTAHDGALEEDDTEVIDLLTREVLWGEFCFNEQAYEPWCGNGRNIKIMEEADKKFVEIVKSKGRY